MSGVPVNSLSPGEPDYVVTEASAESVESLCALFQLVFGQAIEPSVWRWKYQDAALLGHLNVILCAAGGAVLGHVGAILLPGMAEGRSVPIAQLCDIMLAREARGRWGPNGPYARFVSALIARLQARIPDGLYYGFPGKRPFRLGERLGLYRSTGSVAEWRLPIAAATRREIAGSAQGKWPFLRLRPLEWDDGRIDRLWEQRIGEDRGVRLVRDRRYLSWRYVRNPSRSYRLLGLHSGPLLGSAPFGCVRSRHLAGWVVVRREGPVLRCIDRLLDETRLPAVLNLLAGYGGTSGARELAWWASEDRPRPPGTVEHDTGLTGVVLPASALEFAAVRPQWQPGDTDIY